MQALKKKKKLILLTALVVMVLGVLWFWISSSDLLEVVMGTPVDTENFDFSLLDPSSFSSEVGQRLVRTLTDLNDISLNVSFITSNEFVSLDGLPGAIESQPVGRDNPFAPIQ